MMATRFSVIIPVFNEEDTLQQSLEHIRKLEWAESSEIIIVDGDHAGRTIGTIHDEKVIAIVASKGRGNQMNAGAALAKGTVLVFLHADTRLPPHAFKLIGSSLRNPLYGAGAFDLAISSPRPIFRLIEKTASLRSRLTRIPYGDQVLFFRKDYFELLGAFALIPLMEDVEIMRRIKKRGERIVFINHPVVTSARRWEKEGILYCTLRNWLLISLYLAGISPDRLARLYR
jgi:rSAM/selenodomain-associated transferase 2